MIGPVTQLDLIECTAPLLPLCQGEGGNCGERHKFGLNSDVARLSLEDLFSATSLFCSLTSSTWQKNSKHESVTLVSECEKF